MTVAIEAKLRQERALLWRARNLHRHFLGDGGWMPCGIVEAYEDRWIFQPRVPDDNQTEYVAEQRPILNGTPLGGVEPNVPSTAASVKEPPVQQEAKTSNGNAGNEMEMAEIPIPSGEHTANEVSEGQIKEFKSEEADAAVKDLPPHPKATDVS